MELNPETATGVDREVSVLSPSCAAHKASQPLHKPAHPTSRSPLRPSPQNILPPVRRGSTPNTISLQTTPQSHTCATADERVSYRHSNPSRGHLPHSIPQCITPRPRRNIAPPHHTPHAHPKTLLNITTHPTGANARKCGKPATQTRAPSQAPTTTHSTQRALLLVQRPP